MKDKLKYSMLFIAISILLIGNIQAQDASSSDTQSAPSSPLNEMQKLDLELQAKSQNFVEKEIVIPNGLKTMARVLFGLKPEDKIDIQNFVVLIAIWIMLFAIILQIARLIPVLNKGASRWLGAMVLTCLVGVSGAIKTVSDFYYNLFDVFNWAEKYGVVKLIISVIIIGFIIYAIGFMTKRLRRSFEKTQASMTGMKVGMSVSPTANATRGIP